MSIEYSKRKNNITAIFIYLRDLYIFSVIECIDVDRARFPDMEAIYFITPTEESVSALIEDFANPADLKYKAAHVYFSQGESVCGRSFFVTRMNLINRMRFN